MTVENESVKTATATLSLDKGTEEGGNRCCWAGSLPECRGPHRGTSEQVESLWKMPLRDP